MTPFLIAERFVERYGLDFEALKPIVELLKPDTNGPWLVGGSIRRLITGAPQTSDFDVAFSSPSQLDATAESVALDPSLIHSEVKYVD